MKEETKYIIKIITQPIIAYIIIIEMIRIARINYINQSQLALEITIIAALFIIIIKQQIQIENTIRKRKEIQKRRQIIRKLQETK